MGIVGLMTAAGVGTALQDILAQRLKEQELKLRQEESQARMEEQRLQREELSAYRGEQLKNEQARQQEASIKTMMDAYKGFVDSAPENTLVPPEYQGLPRVSGRLRAMPYEGTGEKVPDAMYVGPQVSRGATGFREIGPIIRNGKRVLATVDANDPTKILAEYDAPAPAAQGENGGRPYYTPQIAIGADGKPRFFSFDARTGRFNEAMNPAGPGPLSPRLSGTEQTNVNQAANALEGLSELNRWYHSGNGGTPQRDWIGPLAGRWNETKSNLPSLEDNSFAKMVGADRATSIPNGFADFRAAVANNKNATIKAITGAQMSEAEAKRLVQQIPDIPDRPEMFEAKLKLADRLLSYVYMRWARADEMMKAGIAPDQVRRQLDSTMPLPSELGGGGMSANPYTVQR